MRTRHGFTLLEVVVALSIMALIMTLVWSNTSQSLNARDRIEKRDLVFHSGGVALRKMSEDLMMAFLAGNSFTMPPAPGQQPGAQAAQPSAAPPAAAPAPVPTPESLMGQRTFKTFFIGEDRGDRDMLRFTSLSNMRLFKNTKESDQCKVSYELVEAKDEQGSFNLIRREDPWVDLSTELKGMPTTLAEGVRELNIEYYNVRKGEWIKEWDTEKQEWNGLMPSAVRMNIAFVDPDDADKTIPMSTAVWIPLSKGPIDF